jgi:hypothetical protein
MPALVAVPSRMPNLNPNPNPSPSPNPNPSPHLGGGAVEDVVGGLVRAHINRVGPDEGEQHGQQQEAVEGAWVGLGL